MGCFNFRDWLWVCIDAEEPSQLQSPAVMHRPEKATSVVASVARVTLTPVAMSSCHIASAETGEALIESLSHAIREHSVLSDGDGSNSPSLACSHWSTPSLQN